MFQKKKKIAEITKTQISKKITDDKIEALNQINTHVQEWGYDSTQKNTENDLQIKQEPKKMNNYIVKSYDVPQYKGKRAASENRKRYNLNLTQKDTSNSKSSPRNNKMLYHNITLDSQTQKDLENIFNKKKNFDKNNLEDIKRYQKEIIY